MFEIGHKFLKLAVLWWPTYVTEGDDHSNWDSESESTTEGESDSESESATEGESDEEIASDENSSECEEKYNDDNADAEEEKDLEAPVLPIGFEKLENNHSGSEGIVAEQLDIQVSVENQASTMEIYNTEAEEVAMKTSDQSSVETPISMKNMSPDLLISDCEPRLLVMPRIQWPRQKRCMKLWLMFV